MTHDLRRRLAVVLALGALLCAPAAFAQDAKSLLRKADKLFAAGDYKAALEAYEAGHKLQPQPVFLRSAGYSLLKLYQHEKAREKLRDYLKAAPKAADKAKINELLGTLDVIIETVLSVDSNPSGAALFIDTEAAGQVGTTPFKGSIPPGSHTVILKLAGFHTTVKTFSVEARKKAEFSVPLEVTFKVTSTPSGAAVHLDSETAPSIGPTPYAGGIPVGKRTVFVKLAGYKTFKQEVNVDKGSVEINAELPLGIKVVSTPAGASVELDGKALPGVTPIEETATPGKHQVMVKLEGYKTFTTEIEVAPGKDNTVTANLGGGLLTMRTNVDGAKVAVGSRELGASPMEKRSVPPGKHTVTVTHPDRRPWSAAVDFEEGQAVRAKVRLGRSMAPVWIGAGVAVVGAAILIGASVATKNRIDDLSNSSGYWSDAPTTPVSGACLAWKKKEGNEGGVPAGITRRDRGSLPEEQNGWNSPKTDYEKNGATFTITSGSGDCSPGAAQYLGGVGVGMLSAGAGFALFYYLFGARSTADIETGPAAAATRPTAPKVVFQGNGFRF